MLRAACTPGLEDVGGEVALISAQAASSHQLPRRPQTSRPREQTEKEHLKSCQSIRLDRDGRQIMHASGKKARNNLSPFLNQHISHFRFLFASPQKHLGGDTCIKFYFCIHANQINFPNSVKVICCFFLEKRM